MVLGYNNNNRMGSLDIRNSINNFYNILRILTIILLLLLLGLVLYFKIGYTDPDDSKLVYMSGHISGEITCREALMYYYEQEIEPIVEVNSPRNPLTEKIDWENLNITIEE